MQVPHQRLSVCLRGTVFSEACAYNKFTKKPIYSITSGDIEKRGRRSALPTRA